MITLRKVLRINALSSALSGLLLMVFHTTAASLFGVHTVVPFLITGLVLLLFAALVQWAGIRQPLNRRLTKWIVVLDVTWVIASVVAVLILRYTISTTGHILILGAAAWVAAMALLQHRGLRNTEEGYPHEAP